MRGRSARSSIRGPSASHRTRPSSGIACSSYTPVTPSKSTRRPRSTGRTHNSGAAERTSVATRSASPAYRLPTVHLTFVLHPVIDGQEPDPSLAALGHELRGRTGKRQRPRRVPTLDLSGVLERDEFTLAKY